MLVAYDDCGYKIKDFPTEEARVPLRSIESHSEAERIRLWAATQPHDVDWVIVGEGPFGARGNLR
jgi:hypothetical protein